MIVVNNLKLRPGESEKKLQKMAAQALKIKVEDFFRNGAHDDYFEPKLLKTVK